MNALPQIEVNPENEWRLATPGSNGWPRSPRPGAANKYFIVSCDSHITPPMGLMKEQIEPQYRDRLPRAERRDGVLYQVLDGRKPIRMVESGLSGEDEYRSKSGAGDRVEDLSANMEKRDADLELDGIDAELVFPNGPGLLAYWTSDHRFAQAQFRVYNNWAAGLMKKHGNRLNIAAGVATADVDDAVREIERVAALGFRVVALPNKPIFGPGIVDDINYNLTSFDPLWAAIQDADLTITYHVSTGSDPRVARGPGGAIVNMAVHSFSSTSEPVANMCASGLLDRFPKLRFSSVEAGCGWLPWFLDTMDESYRKHHMWVRPQLRHGLPSDYFRAHGGSTFGEDRSGMLMVEEYGLSDCLCFANDYPHQEGTFPHSAEAIERTMSHLTDQTRAKLLGLNAARMFRFDIPARYT